MRTKSKKPITTKAEADRVKASLVKRLTTYLPIDEAEAGLRIDALNKSGLLKGGNPNDPAIQKAIATFLSIPSSAHAHLK